MFPRCCNVPKMLETFSLKLDTFDFYEEEYNIFVPLICSHPCQVESMPRVWRLMFIQTRSASLTESNCRLATQPTGPTTILLVLVLSSPGGFHFGLTYAEVTHNSPVLQLPNLLINTYYVDGDNLMVKSLHWSNWADLFTIGLIILWSKCTPNLKSFETHWNVDIYIITLATKNCHFET